MSLASGAAYAAAKGGIIAFTRKLAFELGPFGININAIAPSRTLTERLRPRWDQSSPEDHQAEIDRTPLRRGGRPGEGHLFSCLERCRFRHRRHDRCNRRELRPEDRALRGLNPGGS